MEWLLQKALENPGKSYSPQRVAEMLDSHTEAINQNAQALNAKIDNTFWFILAIITLFASINIAARYLLYRKLDKRLKKLEK